MSEHTTSSPASGETKIKLDIPTQLTILPLPGEGIVTPETALAWLRDDFKHFHTVAWNVGAEGSTQDIRTAACFLSLDLGMAHAACVRVIDTEDVVQFYRDDDPREWDIRTLYLARVCGARSVLDHSTGPFEWAFDELAKELARRLGGDVDGACSNPEATKATADA